MGKILPIVTMVVLSWLNKITCVKAPYYVSIYLSFCVIHIPHRPQCPFWLQEFESPVNPNCHTPHLQCQDFVTNLGLPSVQRPRLTSSCLETHPTAQLFAWMATHPEGFSLTIFSWEVWSQKGWQLTLHPQTTPIISLTECVHIIAIYSNGFCTQSFPQTGPSVKEGLCLCHFLTSVLRLSQVLSLWVNKH